METRPVGESGMRVSRIGLGCVTFGREIGEEESYRILDYAAENGITLFDTAESYGGDLAHSSERIHRPRIRSRGCRGRVIVQSKVTLAPTGAHVLAALDASLARLGVDRLDSYLLHSYDERNPVEEFAAAMSGACRASLARAYGYSNYTLTQMGEALDCCRRGALEPPAVIEPIYNLVHRAAEGDLFPFCREHGIGVVTYSPLGAGFLTGKYTPDASADPPGSRFAIKPGHRRIYCHPRGFEALSRLAALAGASRLEMSRLALGWVLRRADVASTLIGATRIEHVRAALEALRHPLPEELMEKLNRLEDSP
jgi:aryl-alcohol dehydrogenase-like predicted oxidoreductase